jgi:hypothetical protein
MSDRERKAAEYRRQAALCLEVAERMSLHEERVKLKDMARQWLALAEEMEAEED